MGFFAQVKKWVTQVYLIEENDPVHGGEQGITNRPLRELADRTEYLKAHLTPKQLGANSTNTSSETGHTHAIDSASTTQKGIVQLNNTLTSTSQEQALTAAQGKVLKDLVDKFQITETTADANTLTTDGIYAYTTVVEGKNLPGNHNYHLFVMGGGNAGWCRQIAKKAYGLETYERTKTSYNGEWSAWKRTDTLGLFSYIQNVNLNDYKQGGFYFVNIAENRPVAHSGALQVFAASGGNGVQQIYTLFNKTETYQRWFDNSNNTWGEWKRIDAADWADIRNKPRTLDGYATTMNGQFTLNHLAALVKGQRNSVDSWFVGLINEISSVVALYSYTYDTGIKLFSDRVESNKPLYVNSSPVFTEATLTPARDTNLTAFIPNTQVKYQDATPAQLPVGTHMGFSQNAQLKDSGVYSGWGMVSKPQNSANSAVRFGINAGRFYFQQANWDNPNEWFPAIELAPKATTLAGYGITDAIRSNAISDAVNSESQTTVGSSRAVKIAYDKAVDAEKKALPLGSVIAFPKAITHPVGFLKCDGTTFNQQTYSDLYRTLGNKNTLPNLQRSDVGQLAYFPSDTIPDGWLACDGQVISQTVYPELYAYLGSKYGANGRLPNAEDRFIRNAGNGLRVGEKQSDELKSHRHKFPVSHGWNSVQENMRNAQTKYSNPSRTYEMPFVLPMDDNLRDNIFVDIDNEVFTGGSETRPKSIIFKLCIKAKNSFDDVQFWIKAFGEVQNSGAMDASRLGQDIQALRAEKADRNHTHTANQITDFAQGVAEQFSYQKIGENEIWKYPDGTMKQILRFHSTNGFTSNWQLRHQIIFPVAFRNTPKCFGSLASEDSTFTNGREDSNKNYKMGVSLNSFIKFNYGDSSGSKLLFWLWNPDGDGGLTAETWHILAIGRWK
ncbi:tail fiber protein [Ursidibacter arcticus]